MDTFDLFEQQILMAEVSVVAADISQKIIGSADYTLIRDNLVAIMQEVFNNLIRAESLFTRSTWSPSPSVLSDSGNESLEDWSRDTMTPKSYQEEIAKQKRNLICNFCKNNGQPRDVYTSHTLRYPDQRVSCPILRRYNCPLCKNGGGDYAHTKSHCYLYKK